MTEAEWLVSGDFVAVYESVCPPSGDEHPLWSNRKDRLLGCACLRRAEHLMTPAELDCVDATERYADGTVTTITLDYTSNETSEVGWFSRNEVEGIIDRGEMNDGLGLTALLLWLRMANSPTPKSPCPKTTNTSAADPS